MLMIRLQRVGKRNSPAFRVVLTDSRRASKSGSFLEILGSYNPQQAGSHVFNKERISHWLSKGVQLSDTMHNLLVSDGVINAPKRSVVPPSKLKKAVAPEEAKKEEKTEVPLAEPVIETPAAEEKQEEKKEE